MDLKLKGKKALVTGSTQGIGYAIAKKLLEEDCAVIINGRDQGRVDKKVEQLSKETNKVDVNGIAADFSKKDEVDALIEKLPEVDILINNVGIFDPTDFTKIPDEDWFKFFEVNIMSGVRLSKHYLPKMLKKDWGRIMFISSESGINIPEEMIHYGATKTMQLGISRGLAELTKGSSVTVNSILPGPTRSEGVEGFVKKMAKENDMSFEEMEDVFFDEARPTSLLQRFTEVKEVANLVAYISSPVSSATNGAALRVDGGVVKSAF